jgi:membrane-bound serine protease (ClpP class)
LRGNASEQTAQSHCTTAGARPAGIEPADFTPILSGKGVLAVRIVQAALVAAIAVAALVIPPPSARAGESGKLAVTISIDGAIGPATASYVKEALAKAAERRAELVILRINTPGGLVTSMREIIADVLASSVPVIGYVAPSGAHAASAGTYILYATHIAAMAPATNLGAATPVQIGGPLPGMPSGKPDANDKDAKDAKPKDALGEKATNDAVALIRGLAELHGHNADWAEKAVREAASLSANAALQEHVIDIVARDPADLLRQVDGRSVEVAGQKRQLATKDLVIEAIDPGWASRFLAVITDPNVALILLLIGVYGLIFEFASPGAVAPGVVGTICLLLGLYALNLLPINYAGAALVLLGIGLMVAEAHIGAFGLLGVGGIIAFLIGAIMMFPTDVPGFQLSPAVIAGAASASAALFLLAIALLLRSRRRAVITGKEALLGAEGEAVSWDGREGRIRVSGEIWRARAASPLASGTRVKVVGRDGLVLVVEPA